MAEYGACSSDQTKVVTAREKLTLAHNLKNEGNDLYGQKMYQQAIRRYHQALLYVRGVEKTSEGLPMGLGWEPEVLTEDMKDSVNSLKVACYNNLAAAMLVMDKPNYARIVEYCEEVIKLAPDNVKALYRKAQAHYELQDTERALQALSIAVTLPAGEKDTKIRKLMKLCQEKEVERDKKSQETYQKMFAHYSPTTAT